MVHAAPRRWHGCWACLAQKKEPNEFGSFRGVGVSGLFQPAALDPGPVADVIAPYPVPRYPIVLGARRRDAFFHNDFGHGGHGIGHPVAFFPQPIVASPAPIAIHPVPTRRRRGTSFFDNHRRHGAYLRWGSLYDHHLSGCRCAGGVVFWRRGHYTASKNAGGGCADQYVCNAAVLLVRHGFSAPFAARLPSQIQRPSRYLGLSVQAPECCRRRTVVDWRLSKADWLHGWQRMAQKEAALAMRQPRTLQPDKM